MSKKKKKRIGTPCTPPPGLVHEQIMSYLSWDQLVVFFLSSLCTSVPLTIWNLHSQNLSLTVTPQKRSTDRPHTKTRHRSSRNTFTRAHTDFLEDRKNDLIREHICHFLSLTRVHKAHTTAAYGQLFVFGVFSSTNKHAAASGFVR